jgi:fluoride exporter
MKALALVMLGGALGAGARHMLAAAMLARFGAAFPWGTLAANVLGGLLAGLLAGWLARSGGNESLRLLLGAGLLGGFTTFSAFSLENWQMIARGQYGLAALYIALSVISAVGAVGAGLWIMRPAP